MMNEAQRGNISCILKDFVNNYEERQNAYLRVYRNFRDEKIFLMMINNF